MIASDPISPKRESSVSLKSHDRFGLIRSEAINHRFR